MDRPRQASDTQVPRAGPGRLLARGREGARPAGSLARGRHRGWGLARRRAGGTTQILPGVALDRNYRPLTGPGTALHSQVGLRHCRFQKVPASSGMLGTMPCSEQDDGSAPCPHAEPPGGPCPVPSPALGDTEVGVPVPAKTPRPQLARTTGPWQEPLRQRRMAHGQLLGLNWPGEARATSSAPSRPTAGLLGGCSQLFPSQRPGRSVIAGPSAGVGRGHRQQARRPGCARPQTRWTGQEQEGWALPSALLGPGEAASGRRARAGGPRVWPTGL